MIQTCKAALHTFWLGLGGGLPFCRDCQTDKRGKRGMLRALLSTITPTPDFSLLVSNTSLETQWRASTLPLGDCNKSQAQHISTPGTSRQQPSTGCFLEPIQQPLSTCFLSLGVSSMLSFLFLHKHYRIKVEISRTRQQGMASHPAVCWFIHISFHFPSICHQILHTPILQCCRVRSRKYGLDSEEEEKNITEMHVCD